MGHRGVRWWRAEITAAAGDDTALPLISTKKNIYNREGKQTQSLWKLWIFWELKPGPDIYGGEMPERHGTFAQMVAVLGQHSNKNVERASPSVSGYWVVSRWMQTLIKGRGRKGGGGVKVFKSAEVVKPSCFSLFVQSFLPCWTLLNSVILCFLSDSSSASFLSFISELLWRPKECVCDDNITGVLL